MLSPSRSRLLHDKTFSFISHGNPNPSQKQLSHFTVSSLLSPSAKSTHYLSPSHPCTTPVSHSLLSPPQSSIILSPDILPRSLCSGLSIPSLTLQIPPSFSLPTVSLPNTSSCPGRPLCTEVVHANTIKPSSAKAVGLGQSWQCTGMQHAAVSLASPLHNSEIPGVWGEQQHLAEEPKCQAEPRSTNEAGNPQKCGALWP